MDVQWDSSFQSSNNEITIKTQIFNSRITDYFYIENTKTILIRSDNKIWKSADEGSSWKLIEGLKDVKVLAMIQNPYFKEHMYFIAQSDTQYYTTDAGETIKVMKVPPNPNLLELPILDFHPTEKGWIIYTSSKNCEDIFSSDCRAVAYYTKNNGENENWNELDTYVRICSWALDTKFIVDKELIYCESYENKRGSQRSFINNPLQFWSSNDFGENKTILFNDIVGFATFEQYMVVAEILQSVQGLRLWVSLNGANFTEAKFPLNMQITKNAYTVLESVTSSIILHVTTSPQALSPWGNILRSGSNGTEFVQSLEFANRDEGGFVDFEKMRGIDGIALANIVSNVDELNMGGTRKKLKSRITFNDGGTWEPLAKPEHDSNDRSYNCSGDCSLHLHGYTERRDPRDAFGSPSAVGLIMGVGNVGNYLTPYLDGDTFLSRDAGKTWNEVRKGAHMYEFGDQGSILIMVNDEEPTNNFLYSFNEGYSWKEQKFTQSTERVRVYDITTYPSGNSSKFLLRGSYEGDLSKEVVIYLDLSAMLPNKCNEDDFEEWIPTHSEKTGCFFGKKIKYYRKISDRICHIDEVKHPEELDATCSCTVQDYECDYNYIRDGESCGTASNVLEYIMKEQCANGETFWYQPSGYRKIPISNCTGGLNYSKTKELCPRASSVLFWGLLVLSSLIIIGAYVIYRKRNRHFGYSTLGHTRIGDSLSSISSFFSSILSVAMDLISLIRVPTFISQLFSRTPTPSSRSRYQYSPLSQDDHNENQFEVSLDDYNNDRE